MMRLLPAAAICVISITLIWACERGSSKEAGTARPNVVVITIDALRADRLGCYGFEPAHTPHIDKLAAEGILTRHVIALAPTTLPSHPSVFTGLEPGARRTRQRVVSSSCGGGDPRLAGFRGALRRAMQQPEAAQ